VSGGADSSPSARGLEARAPRVRNDNGCGEGGVCFEEVVIPVLASSPAGRFWKTAAKGIYLRAHARAAGRAVKIDVLRPTQRLTAWSR